MGETKDLRSRDELVELDRTAWNLPEPKVAPAGAVPEVWPVRAAVSQTREKSPEEPAAA
jgi:hypothetical protein